MNKLSYIGVIMESAVSFRDIPLEETIEVPSDQYAEYLRDFDGEFWLPSPDSQISQLSNSQEVMEPVIANQFPNLISPVFPMVPQELIPAAVPFFSTGRNGS